jgi:hypothetical protein
VKKFKHRFNLPLLFTTIILCCSSFLLINCNSENDFERNINLEVDWQKTYTEKTENNTSTLKKEFELDYKKEKLYLLQLAGAENVLQVKVNNMVIDGTNTSCNTKRYNITNQLQKKNTIEVTVQNTTNFRANLHCVNKLFINDIDSELKLRKKAQLEIRIKNVFSTEKQAVLKYTLYAKNTALESWETPVFIRGNAENIYRQELNFESKKTSKEELKMVCELYCDGNLFDTVNYSF